MTEPTAPAPEATEEPAAEPLNLPAPLGAGQLDADGLRALAPKIRAQLTDSIRQAAHEVRASRGSVVYPEDTYDLVRRLTAGGEALRMVRDAFEGAAHECDALIEEEALTGMGEQDGTLLGSLFVPDGEGQRIAVRAEWKAGTTSWDMTTLCAWLAEDETQDTLAGLARTEGVGWQELSPLQRKEVAAAIADTARNALDRLLALGNYSPGAKKIEELRQRYAEKQQDDTAALLRGLRSSGPRTYQGVKVTREATKK